MDGSVEAFERLVAYEIGEVTAAATYYLAEIYFEFSRSLMASERPPGMADAELAEYELAIEEEAFPFEEKAIAMHEKNIELVRAGVLNAWTDKSLARLAELMPGRYAKDEMSAAASSARSSATHIALDDPLRSAPQSASRRSSRAADRRRRRTVDVEADQTGRWPMQAHARTRAALPAMLRLAAAGAARLRLRRRPRVAQRSTRRQVEIVQQDATGFTITQEMRVSATCARNTTRRHAPARAAAIRARASRCCSA